MTSPHVALALLVAVVWGVAFVFTRLALDSFSPPLLVAIRFAIAAVPVLLLGRPPISWTQLAVIGLTLFVGQFLFQFIGISQGVPVGLASVLVQSEALFTVAFAAVFLRQIPASRQTAALVIAAAGLVCIAGTTGLEFDVVALALIMVSPVSFAIGNVLLQRVGEIDMARLVAWLSLVPPLPGLVLAASLDGPSALWRELAEASAVGWFSAAFLAIAATTFGYGAWGHLLKRYEAASVAPFALLVPFVGAASSAVVFGEQFGPLRSAGMALVMVGLAVLLLPAAWLSRR